MKVRINRIREEKGIILSTSDKRYATCIKTWCEIKKIGFCFVNKSGYDKKVKDIINDFSVYAGETPILNERLIRDNETFLILSGFENKLINQLLEFLKYNDISIPYKCTVTQTNKEWTLYQTFIEIKKEHKAMHSK